MPKGSDFTCIEGPGSRGLSIYSPMKIESDEVVDDKVAWSVIIFDRGVEEASIVLCFAV